jgi:hypothetical protein
VYIGPGEVFIDKNKTQQTSDRPMDTPPPALPKWDVTPHRHIGLHIPVTSSDLLSLANQTTSNPWLTALAVSGLIRCITLQWNADLTTLQATRRAAPEDPSVPANPWTLPMPSVRCLSFPGTAHNPFQSPHSPRCVGCYFREEQDREYFEEVLRFVTPLTPQQRQELLDVEFLASDSLHPSGPALRWRLVQYNNNKSADIYKLIARSTRHFDCMLVLYDDSLSRGKITSLFRTVASLGLATKSNKDPRCVAVQIGAISVFYPFQHARLDIPTVVLSVAETQRLRLDRLIDPATLPTLQCNSPQVLRAGLRPDWQTNSLDDAGAPSPVIVRVIRAEVITTEYRRVIGQSGLTDTFSPVVPSIRGTELALADTERWAHGIP